MVDTSAGGRGPRVGTAVGTADRADPKMRRPVERPRLRRCARLALAEVGHSSWSHPRVSEAPCDPSQRAVSQKKPHLILKENNPRI